MLEFLKLIKSLFIAIINYFYINYIDKLRKYYSDLSNLILKKQRLFIIIPVSITFILSYPSVYSIWNNGLNNNNLIYNADLNIVNEPMNNGLEFMQIWFNYDTDDKNYLNPRAINKNFLEKIWNLQLNLTNEFENHEILIHSPFIFWNNDLDLFLKDENLLKTINSNQSLILNNEYLFGDIIKVNGLIKSAKFIRILFLFKRDSEIKDLIYSKLNEFNQLNLIENDKFDDLHFLVNFSKMNILDNIVLILSYSLIIIYFIISLINLNSVRSKSGLCFAILVQVLLSILSSTTLISLFFNEINFNLQFVPFFILIINVENVFRLLTSISKTKKELSIQHKLSDALSESGLTSSLVVLADLLIFRLIYSYVSKSIKQFLVFTSIALIIDHFLYLTYFTSILSIDLYRLELKDLLDDEKNIDDDDEEIDENLIQNEESNKVKEFFLNIKLPFSSTITGTAILTLTLILINIRWSSDILNNNLNTSNEFKDLFNDLDNLLNKINLINEVLSLSNSKNSTPIDFIKPVIYSNNDVKFINYFNNHISYTFDIYYILEFLTLLIFILSVSAIILRFFTKNLVFDDDKDNKKFLTLKEDNFQVKVLSGGHFLDIIKTSTSNSSFIASIGLDHKVLIWSPMSKPLPKPTQLPISSQLWPIVNVIISDSGNYITIFSKNGIVQCWSRLTMNWVWKFEIPELKKNSPLESFFRYKTIPAFLQRKRAAANKLNHADELLTRSRRNSLRSITSPKLNPTVPFTNNVGINNDVLEDFIIVLKNGNLLTISCQDSNNNISREKLHNSELVSSSKLSTPRVNDRLISYTIDGNILVSTAVNNKWKTRTINVIENTFNNPTNQLTPIISNDENNSQLEINKVQIAIVPFVGFMVKTSENYAELIDVQTGTLIKKFKINSSIKSKSLKVFHSQPTHCRFCGSVSIASFSIAYSLRDSNSLTMHTFKADHKAKTSICLRVERDPREIRCIGFNQVSEHIYEIDNVEGWSCNDQNEIMGLKKKSENEIIESIEKFKKDSILRQRINKTEISLHPSSPSSTNSSSRLYNLWEGWKLTADGKFEIFKIPDVGNSEGLLTNSIGEINKFGHKSIVVVFGNIMKIFYLGNDELIYYENENNNLNSNNLNQRNDKINDNSLNFINKRRILNKNRYNERYNSSNFNEFDSNPGLSHLRI